jgi:hypothetical protein
MTSSITWQTTSCSAQFSMKRQCIWYFKLAVLDLFRNRLRKDVTLIFSRYSTSSSWQVMSIKNLLFKILHY